MQCQLDRAELYGCGCKSRMKQIKEQDFYFEIEKSEKNVKNTCFPIKDIFFVVAPTSTDLNTDILPDSDQNQTRQYLIAICDTESGKYAWQLPTAVTISLIKIILNFHIHIVHALNV